MEYNRQYNITPIGFDVNFTSRLMSEIKKFCERYEGRKCYINEMWSQPADPKCGEDRVDIWLLIQKEEMRDGSVYISDAYYQKVFFINGKVIDCTEYHNLLKEGRVA